MNKRSCSEAQANGMPGRPSVACHLVGTAFCIVESSRALWYREWCGKSKEFQYAPMAHGGRLRHT